MFFSPHLQLIWTLCRKKKAVHKTTSTDDKRLQNTLKRLGVNTIPGIEEVNIFMDETVIHFANPKGALHEEIRLTAKPKTIPTFWLLTSLYPVCSPSVYCRQHICGQRCLSAKECVHISDITLVLASSAAASFLRSWVSQCMFSHAELQDLLPGIINQLGPDNLSHLKKIAQQVSNFETLFCMFCMFTSSKLLAYNALEVFADQLTWLIRCYMPPRQSWSCLKLSKQCYCKMVG